MCVHGGLEDLSESQRAAAPGDFDKGPFRIACPAPGCAFLSESRSRLANARRAVRGHALRVHRAAIIFHVPDGRLEFLSPDQLQARLAAFQRGQMNAEQRRRRGAVPGGGGRPLPSVATRAPGAPVAAHVLGASPASLPPDDAASSRETPPSGAAPTFQARAASSGGSDTQPDLSAAQQDGEALDDWDRPLGAVLTIDEETDAEFLPHGGSTLWRSLTPFWVATRDAGRPP